MSIRKDRLEKEFKFQRIGKLRLKEAAAARNADQSCLRSSRVSCLRLQAPSFSEPLGELLALGIVRGVCLCILHRSTSCCTAVPDAKPTALL